MEIIINEGNKVKFSDIKIGAVFKGPATNDYYLRIEEVEVIKNNDTHIDNAINLNGYYTVHFNSDAEVITVTNAKLYITK